METETDPAKLRALSDAAEHYSKARADERKAKAPKGSGEGSDLVIGFGRAKGKTIGEADTENLEWLRDVLTENVSDPDKAKWKSSNQKMLAAVNAELETRP